jgi:murein hydrolase activator
MITRQGLPGIILVPLLLAFVLIAGYPQMSFSQNLDEITRDRQKLEEEINHLNRLLDQTQKSKSSSMNDLKLINSRIKKREALLAIINREIGAVDAQIQRDQQEINRQSQEVMQLKAEYARLIQMAYKIMKSQTRLAFIFSAKDFNQAYQRLKYYQQYTIFRRKQAEIIREAQVNLNRKMHALENTRAQKVQLKDSEAREKEKLDREKLQKNVAIKDLSKKERELLVSLQKNQEAVRQLQAEIERMIAEEARSRTKSGEPAPGKRDAEIRLSSTFSLNRGRLPWPTDQHVVTSTFGEHPHPVLKYVKEKNNGIDIMVQANSPVKAVFDGTVSRVLTIPNLNKVVIIRHGEYLTVYSNLDRVTVSGGEMIKTGQVIGTVHYNQEEGKAELNFQVWQGKTIMNPQEWLSGY